MRRLLLLAACCGLLASPADAQVGGSLAFPGPGPVKSSGGGGSVSVNAVTTQPTTAVTSAATINNGTLSPTSGANAVVAAISFGSSTSLPSGLGCTWNGSAMTQISGTTTTNGSLSSSSALYGILGATTGVHPLTCSWTGNNEAYLSGIALNGVNQTSIAAAFPNGTSVSNTAATASPISITVTSATGHIVVASFGQSCAVWGTISGTTYATNTTGPNLGIAGSYSSGAASVTATAAYTGTCAQIASGTDVSP
jgi:hypothetical protein